MEQTRLHRGRLIDHIQLVVRDLAASEGFYRAVMAVLEIPVMGTDQGNFLADERVVSAADSPTAAGALTGRHHLAFQAKDRAAVDAFFGAALAHGGRDNGAPGLRAYHPEHYAAFVLAPDGNNIEAVYQGEAKRSARSVTIEVQARRPRRAPSLMPAPGSGRTAPVLPMARPFGGPAPGARGDPVGWRAATPSPTRPRPAGHRFRGRGCS
ncbi:hypothetical protein DSD19_08255 [Rhodovulum sp. BSW8]|nr:hypothetical protein DSD19_08255 [Rhodovulum sp. BSW8]